MSNLVNFDQQMKEIFYFFRDVNSVAWNPVYANVLLSASDDEAIKLWNVSYDQFGTLI